MSFQLKLVCFSAILTVVIATRPFDLIFDELKCTSHAPIKEMHCHKYDKENKTYIDANLVLAKEAKEISVTAVVQIVRSGGEPMTLANLTFDGCKFLEGATTNDIAKTVLQALKKSGNIPTKCPVPPNENYIIKELYIDADILPVLTPSVHFIANTIVSYDSELAYELYVKGRVEMKKKSPSGKVDMNSLRNMMGI